MPLVRYEVHVFGIPNGSDFAHECRHCESRDEVENYCNVLGLELFDKHSSGRAIPHYVSVTIKNCADLSVEYRSVEVIIMTALALMYNT